MIGAVRAWLTSVVVVSLLLAVAQTLIPEGSIRKIAGFTGGLVLLVALMQPLLGADLGGLRLNFGDYADAVQDRQAELEDTEKEQLATLIAQRTEAYISDKAAELGLDVRVQVRTEPSGDGTPIPAAAELFGPWSQPLATLMEQELGIPQERQVWHGEEHES